MRYYVDMLNTLLITAKVEPKHKEMLKEIAKFYRVPNSASHAVRLMIEDKFKEITKGKFVDMEIVGEENGSYLIK